MNRFLTEKATEKRWWEIPVVGFLAVLGKAATEDTIRSYWLYRYADPIATATVTALTFLIWLPIIKIIHWHIRRHRAKVVANRLEGHGTIRIPLADLDRALGIRHAERKIDDLIKNGFLRGIKNDGGCLIIDVAEAAPAPPEQTAPAPTPQSIIQKIRWLNDEIDDAAVSARIDQIEAITSDILRTVRERPERAGVVGKFMDYYLPTTLKLLESYRLMEDQPYQGENIQAARERIEDVLGKLVTAMEAQQERLFSAEAADVAAEIEALEKMMAADGLGESQMFRR